MTDEALHKFEGSTVRPLTVILRKCCISTRLSGKLAVRQYSGLAEIDDAHPTLHSMISDLHCINGDPCRISSKELSHPPGDVDSIIIRAWPARVLRSDQAHREQM